MNCLDCKRADCCHNERKKDLHDLAEGLKFLEKGYFLAGFEVLELLQKRMESKSLTLTDRMEEKV